MKGNPDSGLIQESFACGIQNLGKFAFGILNPGFWIPECSSRNPQSTFYILKSRIPVRFTKTWIQYLESEIHGVESRIQDYSLTWSDVKC